MKALKTRGNQVGQAKAEYFRARSLRNLPNGTSLLSKAQKAPSKTRGEAAGHLDLSARRRGMKLTSYLL